MAITSMTGYGRIEEILPEGEVSIEIKSVNNRYLEVSLKIPKEIQPYEIELKELLGKHLKRGSVYCSINLNLHQKMNDSFNFNEDQAIEYIVLARRLTDEMGLAPMNVADLLKLPEVMTAQTKHQLPLELWGKIKTLVLRALDQVKVLRFTEGSHLAMDLKKRLAKISACLDEVERVLPLRLEEHQAKLKTRLEKLLGDAEIEPQRLVQEIAVLADKMDITEEIVRFRSHNQLFIDTLESEGPHGKKLNFILQEMGREANTMGTKSLYSDLQHIAITLKEEIEIIREQVQNLE